jgi:hypothetical protein
MIHKEQVRRGSGPCSAVKWIRERGQLHLLTSFSTGKIASFALSDGSIRKISAVSVGVAVSSSTPACAVYVVESFLMHDCLSLLGEMSGVLGRYSFGWLFGWRPAPDPSWRGCLL